MKLYFIAIVPEKKLKREIQLIKENFAEKYNSRHALKLPPHITLIPPFKIKEEKEEILLNELENVSNKEKPFTVDLSGYGSFKPRVIFIDVKNKTPVTELFFRVKNAIKDHSPEISKKMEEIHLHITIATRDLSREAFKEAWPNYRNQSFNAEFEVKNLVLFCHNGKNWEKVPGSFDFDKENRED